MLWQKVDTPSSVSTAPRSSLLVRAAHNPCKRQVNQWPFPGIKAAKDPVDGLLLPDRKGVVIAFSIELLQLLSLTE